MVKIQLSHLKHLHRTVPVMGAVTWTYHITKKPGAGGVDFGEEEVQEEMVSRKGVGFDFNKPKG